jgi:hypothetical protein
LILKAVILINGEDCNKINKIARGNLKKKMEQSSLKTNAQNRLLTELQWVGNWDITEIK